MTAVTADRNVHELNIASLIYHHRVPLSKTRRDVELGDHQRRSRQIATSTVLGVTEDIL